MTDPSPVSSLNIGRRDLGSESVRLPLPSPGHHRDALLGHDGQRLPTWLFFSDQVLETAD